MATSPNVEIVRQIGARPRAARLVCMLHPCLASPSRRVHGARMATRIVCSSSLSSSQTFRWACRRERCQWCRLQVGTPSELERGDLACEATNNDLVGSGEKTAPASAAIAGRCAHAVPPAPLSLWRDGARGTWVPLLLALFGSLTQSCRFAKAAS